MGRFHVFVEFNNKNWSGSIVMLRISIYIPYVKGGYMWSSSVGLIKLKNWKRKRFIFFVFLIGNYILQRKKKSLSSQQEIYEGFNST